jgi:hypothetical protein
VIRNCGDCATQHLRIAICKNIIRRYLLKYFVTILTHNKTRDRTLDAAAVNASHAATHTTLEPVFGSGSTSAQASFSLVALADPRAADGARYRPLRAQSF